MSSAGRPLQVNELRRRVQLQSNVPAATGYGQRQPNWQTVGTYWAQVRPLSGRELENARQIKAEVTHRITLRYQGPAAPLNPTQRFLLEGRVFNIVSVVNVDERNRQYDCLCTEQVTPP